MILSEAKSGSFLQRRSVMPGGGGKCVPNVEGRVEMVMMTLLCLQCFIYWWCRAIFWKDFTWGLQPFDWLITIGYEVLPKLSGRWRSEMGEVQLQLFHKMLQHHHKTPKYFRSSQTELKGFFRVALKKKVSNIEEFQIFVVWQLGLIPGSRP